MLSISRLYKFLFVLVLTQLVFADPPVWEDDPGAYEFTATLAVGIVSDADGVQMGDEGDILAAFGPSYICDENDENCEQDGGTEVRGVG